MLCVPETRFAKSMKSAPLIGAHVTGGIKGATDKALEIGAQSMQIFIGSPQTWREPNPALSDLNSLSERMSEHKLGPMFVHGNYLVNLASQTTEIREKSVSN